MIDLALTKPIRNINLSTNGIRLATDKRFVRALGERNGRDGKAVNVYLPADRADPGSGTIQLAVGVARSGSEDPADDPTVYLAGGPGQGTLELVPQALGQLYEPLTGRRDLVLVDQRGTGLSRPSLACEEYTSWVEETLGADLPPEELATQAVQELESCR